MRFSTSLALVACVLSSSAYAEQLIDFSQTEGFGLSQDKVMIKNIRVDAIIQNPFDPAHPTITSMNYDVPFRFDRPTLHLVPELGGASADTPARNCANLTVLVNNAFNGNVLSGASVMVGNSRSESTNTDGNAVFASLPAGQVQVNASSTDFSPSARTETLVCGDNRLALSLSPTQGAGALQANQVRVILNWGQEPYDLDSHLTGPQPGLSASGINEADRFHIYWWNKTSDDGVVGVLDVDDVDSFGPETVTVSPPSGQTHLRAGIYRYSVYHYGGVGTLADNTSVNLIIGSDSRTFTPPAGSLSGAGDLWTVFELKVDNNGSISVLPVNTYSSSNVSSDVRSGERSATGYGEVESDGLFSQRK